jgi:hypothetical protein
LTGQERAVWEHNAVGMKSHPALVFFSLCAVVDFAFGYIKGHSGAAGIVVIVVSLPFNAVLFFVFKAFRKPGDSK